MTRWISASVLFAGLAVAPLIAQTTPPARRGTPPPTSKPAAPPTTAKPAAPPTTAKPATAAPARGAAPATAAAFGPGTYAHFTTSNGNFIVRLYVDDVPKTAANFIGLATGKKAWKDPKTGRTVNRPLYNGTLFHRVIPNFMIQGGDPLGDGTGGPGSEIADEINPKYHHNKAGVMSMANHGPNTNGSQFFITVAAYPSLDGHYSIFGEVVDGLDNVVAISQVPRSPSANRPITPVVMKSVRIETVK